MLKVNQILAIEVNLAIYIFYVSNSTSFFFSNESFACGLAESLIIKLKKKIELYNAKIRQIADETRQIRGSRKSEKNYTKLYGIIQNHMELYGIIQSLKKFMMSYQVQNDCNTCTDIAELIGICKLTASLQNQKKKYNNYTKSTA